ncbi:DMT family transporter [uncultured Tateyamaria sp.]|uniref:DMT family transporter n=1 Tax=uncultured Tateyamaria sp. TaxID=455651 RepID=UPI00345BF608
MLTSPYFGTALGTLTVLCWASYNVAAKQGIEDGLTPEALAFLRFAVPGLIALPLACFLALGQRKMPIRLGRLAVLVLLGGPIFGVIAVTGYEYAPLSHGLLFAPVAVFLSGGVLGHILLKDSLSKGRVFGALVMFTGLAVLVGFQTSGLPDTWWVGAFFFVCAGMFWGAYTVLIKKWEVSLLSGTIAVASGSAVMAAVVLGPVALGTLASAPLQSVVFQAIMQGLIGGVLSVVALIGAVRALPTQVAALLPTFTPGVALFIALMANGVVPTPAEIAGCVLVLIGFLVSATRHSPGNRRRQNRPRRHLCGILGILVPRRGLEPPRPYGH